LGHPSIEHQDYAGVVEGLLTFCAMAVQCMK
jgi:hypothetical protein